MTAATSPPVGPIDQRLQGDQRTLHRIRPVRRLVELIDPASPNALRICQRLKRLQLSGLLLCACLGILQGDVVNFSFRNFDLGE